MYYDLRAHPSVEAKLTEMNYKVALETKIIKGVTTEKELTRITIILNTQQCFKNTDSYDLVAVQPQDEKMFALACKQLDVDIISFDFTQRLDYHFKLPNVNSAISRGICFEICYADALKNQSGLGNFLEGATALIRATKGKNVIISSNANSLMEVRGSIDVVNMAFIFGLNQSAARECLTTWPRLAIMHASNYRKLIKSTLQVEEIQEKHIDKKLKTN